MVKIAVNGACGRMGLRILSLAAASPTFEIIGAFENEKSGNRGKTLTLESRNISVEGLTKDSLKGKGVLVDFSGTTGTPTALLYAQKAKWGLVVGTTGLDRSTEETLRLAGRTIPIVRSSNMSVGVTIVQELLKIAAEKLPTEFNTKITEAHHVHKKDAPSGTALMLLKTIADAKHWSSKKFSEEKSRVQSIREGEIVGDHSVIFEGPAESIEVRHHAGSRDTFARGALLAAQFISKKKKGFFTMKDVLAL